MRVAVIGGGLAGLAAASELAPHADVTVLEAGDRFGGQVRTTKEEGFVVEDGADTFGAAGKVGTEWASSLGIADLIQCPPDLPTLILMNGALDRLQSGTAAALLGVPDAGADGTAAPCTLKSGMEELVHAATAALQDKADLRVGTSAVALAHEEGAWRVFPEIGAAIRADALVLALPPKSAAWLVHAVDQEAARHLTHLSARSVVVVSLGISRDDVSHPLDASGFSVPIGPSGAGLQACIFTSTHFPGRAPEDHVLLRAVIRPARGELASMTDAEWADKVAALLDPVLGIRGSPRFAWVARWADAVPEKGTGTAAEIAAGRAGLRAHGPAEFAGAAFGDPGIDGAILSGRQAATRLLADD